MAKQTNKSASYKKAQAQAEAQKTKAKTKNKKILIIVSAALAVALVAGLIIGLVACNANKEVDYINDDLSKYVYISEDDYKNFPVTSPLLTVDESDVRVEINKLLVKNKSKEALYNGASVRPESYTIKIGDVVNIRYRAYTTDENGITSELAGTSNFTKESPTALEIGSGTFIKGFEEGLIGKKLHEKSLEIAKTGTVKRRDVVYISYSAFLPDGTPTTVSNVRIDTRDQASVDKTFGAGFTDFLIGKVIGDKGVTQTFRVEGETVDTVYYEMKIDYVVRSAEKPYLLDVQFPVDYKEASLRGVKATFEVYASTAVIYKSTPEWSDSFVSETLKETFETLSAYEGETLTEKYENKILAELNAAKEEANKTLIQEDMFRHYLSKAKVKKLPKAEVKKKYDQYIAQAKQLYDLYYVLSYESFDEFANEYFPHSANQSWQDAVTAAAESAVTETLVFFYIIREENIIPSAEEYELIYNESLKEYKEYYVNDKYKSEIDACETEEEKPAKILEIESRVLKDYGEQYFRELTYYKYGMERILVFADLK